MADDLRHVDRVQVVRDYEARFGPEGEFDCWIFDGEVNMRLMLIGLGRGKDETSQIACLASLGYLLAYAVIGRPENFYWGLLPAPLLAWGFAQAPRALFEMVAAAGLLQSRDQSSRSVG